MAFQKAEKAQSKLRLLLAGPSGSGKTLTGLQIAETLASEAGGRVAVICGERGSAALYGDTHDFDVDADFRDYTPESYISKIQAADKAGYAAILIDSISPEWDACLDAAGGDATKWRTVGPRHDRFVAAILVCKAHVICTVRVDHKAVFSRDKTSGKVTVDKVTAKIKQRGGIEHEFDMVCLIDQHNTLTVDKSRCRSIPIGKTYNKDGASLATELLMWLNTGAAQKQQYAPQGETPAAIEARRLFEALTVTQKRIVVAQFDKATGRAYADKVEADMPRVQMLCRAAVLTNEQNERLTQLLEKNVLDLITAKSGDIETINDMIKEAAG